MIYENHYVQFHQYIYSSEHKNADTFIKKTEKEKPDDIWVQLNECINQGFVFSAQAKIFVHYTLTNKLRLT